MKSSTLETAEKTPQSTPFADVPRFRMQVDKLLHSSSFRETPSCRKLLRYIVDQSLAGNQDALKELTIGMEVLGRRADFDPKTDTIVRVQARRLRQKIAQYYETEGQQDPVIISIPKGSYAAEFALRDDQTEGDNLPDFAPFTAATLVPVLPPLPADERSSPMSSRMSLRGAMLILVALLCSGAGGYWLARHPSSSPKQTQVQALWSAMLKGDDAPIIAYPDAVFLLDGASDMFQFNEGPVGTRGEVVDPGIARRFAVNPAGLPHAGPMYYENGGYTGTGEIESVARLTEVLNQLGMHPKVIRSHDLTTNDLRNHHVILLGGSAQNKAVRDFLPASDFQYNDAPGAWGGTIVNRNPLAGEHHSFHVERNSGTQAIEGDYAIVSCQPGVDSSRHIITLGGMDTAGTLGATIYATSLEGAEGLANAFGKRYQAPYFQMVIHVLLAHGNQVLNTQPVLVRGSSS